MKSLATWSARVLAIAACAAITLPAMAAKELKAGSKAPGLDIETWVKGTETTIAKDRVYVVEFWATWCAPCKRSIPHLTELQQKYEDKGLTIIGISTEEIDVVEPFVRRMGDKMGYTVAVDRRKSTNRTWMDAAKKNTIPTAFIVDKTGTIAWVGNPLDSAFDRILAKVVSGRYNPDLEAAAAPVLEAARSARKARSWRMAMKQYDDVIKLDPQTFAEVGLERFGMMLLDMKQPAEAYAYAKTELIGNLLKNDAEALAWLAEKIATDPELDATTRDMDVALAAAEKSRAVRGAKSPDGLAIVALVKYHRGETDEAIALQKQAYFSAVPRAKAEYKRTLDVYTAAAHRAASAGAQPAPKPAPAPEPAPDLGPDEVPADGGKPE